MRLASRERSHKQANDAKINRRAALSNMTDQSRNIALSDISGSVNRFDQ